MKTKKPDFPANFSLIYTLGPFGKKDKTTLMSQLTKNTKSLHLIYFRTNYIIFTVRFVLHLLAEKQNKSRKTPRKMWYFLLNLEKLYMKNIKKCPTVSI